jgi:hypothetical protein
MYCQALKKGAHSGAKGCEHFGDNIPKLACIQYTVSLKCFTEVGETAFATRRPPEKPAS